MPEAVSVKLILFMKWDPYDQCPHDMILELSFSFFAGSSVKIFQKCLPNFLAMNMANT